MDGRYIRAETPLQASLAEQALVLAKQLEEVAAAAPHGKVLARLEQAAVAGGREFVRVSLEQALQVQATEVEKKLHRLASVPAANAAGTKGAPHATS